MTASEVIRELQRFPPDKPVRVVMHEVFFRDEQGETLIRVSEGEAELADDVRNEGAYILIRGR